MRWRGQHRWPAAVGKLDLAVMSAAFTIFGASLISQSHRWHATPAYHILLEILPAPAWGALFLISGISMGTAAWQFAKRWLVVGALTLAFTLTTGWMLSFVVRYVTSPSTTPETWVSWAVFAFLLLKVARSIDHRPPLPPPGAEVAEFHQAVDDALTAAEEGLRAALDHALNETAGRRRAAVTAAVSAYGDALRAIVPAAVPPAGDTAAEAIGKVREAAGEAYERATGQPAPQDPP